jgi:protein-S-isoprenylcysteine O-methyltransferase Ste14
MVVSVPTSGTSATRTSWKRRWSLLQDACLVGFSGLFVYAHAQHAIEHQSIANVFFVVEQGLLLFLFLVRRRTNTTSQRPADWLVATIGGWGALAMRPQEAGGSVEVIGVTVQLAGLVLVTFCFSFLGKSFGIVAANRGLKVRGPYSIVRHPVYLCHAITQLGFIIANPWWPNFFIFFVISVFQVLRIGAEERVLSETSDYQAYSQTVRWRLVPGVF